MTVQEEVPEQSPAQPVNTDVESGVAVRVTDTPELKSKAHVVPQLIPAGLDVTVPDPVPVFGTLSVVVVNVAVTLLA